MKKVTKEISAAEKLAKISLFHCCAWKLSRPCLQSTCCACSAKQLWQIKAGLAGFTHHIPQSSAVICTGLLRGLLNEIPLWLARLGGQAVGRDQTTMLTTFHKLIFIRYFSKAV